MEPLNLAQIMQLYEGKVYQIDSTVFGYNDPNNSKAERPWIIGQLIYPSNTALSELTVRVKSDDNKEQYVRVKVLTNSLRPIQIPSSRINYQDVIQAVWRFNVKSGGYVDTWWLARVLEINNNTAKVLYNDNTIGEVMLSEIRLNR